MKREKVRTADRHPLPLRHRCLAFFARGWLAGLLVPAAFGLWRRNVWEGVAFAFALNSLLCALFYREDKALAEQGMWRIPERCLHMWELAGGWPGAIFAWRHFRHKSRKGSFLAVSILCILLDLAALAGYAAWSAGLISAK